jgi:hypothetical protein
MMCLGDKLANTPTRKNTQLVCSAFLALAIAGCSPQKDNAQSNAQQADAPKVEKSVDYCALASKDDLAKLYRKPLFASAEDNGCMWSETKGGMADLELHVQDSQGKLRDYFATDLPSNVKLVDITDLGDSGMMSVTDGSIGVVVIRKGNKDLQSAATFLDIKPGSDAQKVLWQIYGRALGQ